MIPKQIRVVDPGVLAIRRKERCWACNAPPPSQCAHIKTRGSYGPDELFNCMALCQRCHNLQGTGWSRFFLRYPRVLWKLRDMGWKHIGGKMQHERLEFK